MTLPNKALNVLIRKIKCRSCDRHLLCVGGAQTHDAEHDQELGHAGLVCRPFSFPHPHYAPSLSSPQETSRCGRSRNRRLRAVVLVAFFHYIPKELRAYFSPVPFASGLVISRFTILPIRTRRGWRSSPSPFITSPPRSTPSPSSVPANAERRIIRRKTTFKRLFRRINTAFCADFPEVVLG